MRPWTSVPENPSNVRPESLCRNVEYPMLSPSSSSSSPPPPTARTCSEPYPGPSLWKKAPVAMKPLYAYSWNGVQLCMFPPYA